MDALDILKKDWNKEESQNFPKLSYNDIYQMILKKSSSHVKWIFIISMLEFVLWIVISTVLNVLNPKGLDYLQGDAEKLFLNAITVIGYVVLFYFFYLFYRNYKKISSTNNVKTLMENILKTRRTVKQYVAFNVLYLVIGSTILLSMEFLHNKDFLLLIERAESSGNPTLLYLKFFFISAGVILAAGILLWLFYALIYGILLKRLNKNYKELKKIDL